MLIISNEEYPRGNDVNLINGVLLPNDFSILTHFIFLTNNDIMDSNQFRYSRAAVRPDRIFFSMKELILDSSIFAP